MDCQGLEHIQIDKTMQDYLNQNDLNTAEVFFTKRRIYFIKELREMKEQEKLELQKKIEQKYIIKHYRYLPTQKKIQTKVEPLKWYEKYKVKQVLEQNETLKKF